MLQFIQYKELANNSPSTRPLEAGVPVVESACGDDRGRPNDRSVFGPCQILSPQPHDVHPSL